MWKYVCYQCINVKLGQTKLFVHGYNSVFKCRTNFGGGVALLIKEIFDFNELDLSLFNEEIVGFTTKIGAHNRDIILHIQNNYANYLIMGDLNSKNEVFNCKSTNKNGEILNNILTSTNGQILNENFDSTFYIIRDYGNNNFFE